MASSSREIILASSPNTPITAYDPFTGTALAQFSGSHPPRKGLTLAGNSFITASHISSTTTSGSIRLYNWWSPTALHCFPLPEPVFPITSTPDGSYLFSGGLSGQIHVISLPSGDTLRSVHAHAKPVSCLVISDDGSLLISGGDDGRIAVFPILHLLDSDLDLAISSEGSNGSLYKVPAHELPVTAMASGMGGSAAFIVSSSLDCTCKFWNLTDGAHLRTVQFPCAIWCAVMDSTDSELFAGGSDGRVYIAPLTARGGGAEANAVAAAWVPEQLTGGVTALAMADGDRNLVSASEDGVVRIWEVESRVLVRVFEHGQGSVSDLVVARVGGVGIDREGCKEEKLGFSAGLEISRPVRELEEMEEWLSVVEEERRRALNMLEGAIGTYERLLRLFLKEATKCGARK